MTTSTRQTALTALRAIGGATKDAVPDLVEALKSPNAGVRYQVAEMIRELGPDATAAVPALKQLLKDASPEARLQALRVLHRVSPDDLADALPVLIELMQAKEQNTRNQAFQVIGELGPAVAKSTLPVILEALKSPDATIRSLATSALTRLEAGSQPEVRAALRDILTTGDAEARLQVVYLVERGGADERKVLIPAMAELLKNEKVAIRMRAADVLRRQGEEGLKIALPVLRDALKDNDPSTQVHAAWSLLQGSSPGRIVPHPSSTPTDDQKAAVAVVASCGAEVRPAGPADDGVERPPVLTPDPFGGRSRRVFAEAAADAQPQTRFQAAQFLTRLDGADREAGIKALADLGSADQRQQGYYYRSQAVSALAANLGRTATGACPGRTRRPQGPDPAGTGVRGVVSNRPGRGPRRDPPSKGSAGRGRPAVPHPGGPVADPLRRGGGDQGRRRRACGVARQRAPEPSADGGDGTGVRPEWAKAALPVFREMLAVPTYGTQILAARHLLDAGDADMRGGRPGPPDDLEGPPVPPPHDRLQAAQLLVRAASDRTDEAAAALRGMLKGLVRSVPGRVLLADFGPDHKAAVLPVIREMLADPNPNSRQQAVGLIGSLNLTDKELLPAVTALLDDQRGFSTSWHWCSGRSAQTPFRSCSRRPSPRTRRAAARRSTSSGRWATTPPPQSPG